ncbi:MAG: hypothetical protein JJ896_07985 [Rhodothermales bacterium]|nr:hypothetical protein [Rhodothermales bacterium]MBO6779580.1 hypothetical protein [Rhodothermales bacterium]
MGKAALILVAAVSVASTTVYMTQDRQSIETLSQEAVYEHQVLAREIAQSAFNRVESRVRRDFENHRVSLADVAHRQGEMDITAVGTAGSPVAISATGRFEDAEYTISGVLSRSGSRVLDALTVDGAVEAVDFSGNAMVSGLDTDPDGSDGSNQDVHAVLATTTDAYTDFLAEVVAGVGPGVAGLADVLQGTPETNLDNMSTNILAYSGGALTTYTGDQDLSDTTLGSAGSPVVLRVTEGDLTLSGTFTGYGILYLDGTLVMEDDARWEGLIFIEEDGGDHILRDDARVYGAVVIRSIAQDGSGDDGGLPGGHFDVDVFDEFGVGDYRYHEHKYDDDFDVTGIDLLDPTGCGSGGLCWSSILGSEDAVYVSFKNETYGYGTFDIEAGAGSVTSTCDDGGGGGGGGGGDSDDDDDDGGDSDDDDDGGWDFSAGADMARASQLTGLFSGLGSGNGLAMCHDGTTINVSGFAVLAHLWHGDSIGACSEPEDEGDGCEPTTTNIPAVDLAGNTHEGLSATLLDSREVTSFSVNFEYLCALMISSPNGVIYDPTDRNDAFTIQIHDASHDGSSWNQGSLLYETSVYHHTGYGWWDDPGGEICDPLLGGGDIVQAGDPLELDVEDDALIQYSSLAMTRIKDLLAEVDPGSGSITLGDVSEAGVRPKKLAKWLGLQ